MICNCPASAALPDMPNATCPESFGQIQKVAFQRLTKADGTKNSFDGTDGTPVLITVLADWTAFMAAADGTKIVVSPYVQAPTNEAGAARTFGGGNETISGIEEIIGSEPSAFTGVLRKVPQAVVKVLKELVCEASAGNLGVYLFDENGQIEAIEDPDTPTKYYPIPIRALFVSDKGHGGYEAPDSNNIQWQFPPNYSDDLAIVTPTDFNPLTDLVNP